MSEETRGNVVSITGAAIKSDPTYKYSVGEEVTHRLNKDIRIIILSQSNEALFPGAESCNLYVCRVSINGVIDFTTVGNVLEFELCSIKTAKAEVESA